MKSAKKVFWGVVLLTSSAIAAEERYVCKIETPSGTVTGSAAFQLTARQNSLKECEKTYSEKECMSFNWSCPPGVDQ